MKGFIEVTNARVWVVPTNASNTISLKRLVNLSSVSQIAFKTFDRVQNPKKSIIFNEEDFIESSDGRLGLIIFKDGVELETVETYEELKELVKNAT